MTHELTDLAKDTAKGRLLLTLEGGYNLFGLQDGVRSVLLTLSGQEPGSPAKLNVSASLERELAPIFKVQKAFWPVR